jgi:hypothetical protein
MSSSQEAQAYVADFLAEVDLAESLQAPADEPGTRLVERIAEAADADLERQARLRPLVERARPLLQVLLPKVADAALQTTLPFDMRFPLPRQPRMVQLPKPGNWAALARGMFWAKTSLGYHWVERVDPTAPLPIGHWVLDGSSRELDDDPVFNKIVGRKFDLYEWRGYLLSSGGALFNCVADGETLDPQNVHIYERLTPLVVAEHHDVDLIRTHVRNFVLTHDLQDHIRET